MGETTDSFGYWLRRRRKALDLTQAALGTIVGCTAGMVRRIEADERRPSRELAERLADALALPTVERAPFLRAARGELWVDRLAVADEPVDRELGAAANNLPAPPNALIGRAAEAAVVWELLCRTATRLVVMTGPGGSGKTRLALQVAADSAAQFPDGVAFVDLTAVRDPALALPAILAGLGMREQPGITAHAQLVAFLPGRRLLLLDNFEQILAAGPQLAALLAALPDLKLLVTSRFPLRLRAEQAYPVPPLGLPADPDERDPETLAQAESVQLFLARARDVQPEHSFSPADLVAIAAICRALGGLPLAIELAAAWVRVFTPELLLARLQRPLELLVGGPHDAPDRQQTLRATIDWSYRLLSPAEQRCFRSLGVCAGGWTIEAAEALAGPEALLLLRTLAERHMILARESSGEPRFDMLETLREYAQEQLAASGALEAARRRHGEHFADLAERAEPHMHSFDSRRWMERLEADLDNLRAALRWSLETADGPPIGLRLIGASWRYWELSGRRHEGRTWMGALLAQPAARPPTPDRSRALYGAAYMADQEGDFAAADRLIEELEHIGKLLGDKQSEARALLERGRLRLQFMSQEQCMALLKRSLAIFEQIGDQLGVAWALWELGFMLLNAPGDKRNPEIDRYLERALAQARAIGAGNTVTTSLHVLAQRAMGRGELPRARGLFTQALASAEASGDLRTRAHTIGAFGDLAMAEGDLAAAEQHYSSVLGPARKLGEIISINMALEGLAQIAYWRGESAAGEAYMAEALHHPLNRQDQRYHAWLTRMLGVLAEQRGDLTAAHTLLHQSLEGFRALGDTGGSAFVLASLGHLLQRQGDSAGADAAFRESIAGPAELGPFRVSSCLIGMATLAEEAGDGERAARLWGAAEGFGAGSRPDRFTSRPDDAPRVAAARARLCSPGLRAAWAAGRALTCEQAVAEALG